MQKKIMLVAMLKALTEIIESDDCHMSDEALDAAINQIKGVSSPAQSNMTAYMVCQRLGGITERTLRNWVNQGLISKPHSIAGTNTKFWYSDEIEKDVSYIKTLGYLRK